jgi:hypothetical protein
MTEEELQEFELTGDPSDPISDRELAQWASFKDEERIFRARHKDWLGQESQRILALQGLPALHGYYRHSERGWLRWEQSDEYELETMRILRNPLAFARQCLPRKVRPEPGYRALEEIAEEAFGTDSKAHFAARIVGLMHQLRIARRENFQSEVEYIIFTLGECYSTWKLKHQAEDVWELGKRVRSGGQQGAKLAHGPPEVREQRKVQIQHKVESYIAQGLKKMKAYERAAKESKIAVITVRRYCSTR